MVKNLFVALAVGLVVGLAISFTGIPEPWSAAIAGAIGGIAAVAALKLGYRK